MSVRPSTDGVATVRMGSGVRNLVCALLLFVAYGCATTAPPPPKETDTIEGIASWYGEEFAGRTTANGEIFDPALLTAAHRTLPFGTVLDVTNPSTSQTVRVRVNDRGPYIGNRVIDLSYAAASQIGLIEPGIGQVRIAVVKLGSGEREPPVPFDVTIAEAPASVPAIAGAEPPPVEFPLPGATPSEPVTVDRVEAETQRGGAIVRRQVSADGRTIEEVEVTPEEAGVIVETPPAQTPVTPPPVRRPTRVRSEPRVPQFYVQVGAFAVEKNALALQRKLEAIGQPVAIDRNGLYKVRIGPFTTRDEAAQARGSLEAKGISAIIVAE